MNSEQEKQWREEFEKEFPSSCYMGKKYTNDSGSLCYSSLDTTRIWGAFLAAKTSSYEREIKRDVEIRDCLKSIEISHVSADDVRATELIETIEFLLVIDSKNARYKLLDELEKLQERITELELDLLSKSTALNFGFELEDKYRKELAKRDQLIFQAMDYVEFAINYSTPLSQKKSEEWLKQAGELKK